MFGYGPANIKDGEIPDDFHVLPMISEHLLAFDGFLVILNFIYPDIVHTGNVADQKMVEYAETRADFYAGFETYMLNELKK